MLRAITLFVILNLLDLAGTLFLLGQHSGVFYELNPIARFCLYWASWQGISAHKIFWTSVVAGIATYINFHKPCLAIRLIDGLSCIVFVTCLWTGLIYLTGGMMVAALVCGIICLMGVVIALGLEHSKLRQRAERAEREAANWRLMSQGHTSVKLFTTETFT